MSLPDRIPLEAIHAARDRLAGIVLPTPMLSIDVPGAGEVFLKAECLQPIGSFKIRGAGNALLNVSLETLRGGVVTASAGNMAQGVAWWARRLGVPCTAIVPENAPHAKLGPFEAMGGQVHRVPYDVWWRTLQERGHPDVEGYFVHPVADADVMAGNGTIGLELLLQVPNVDTVLVPFGGGGLACGIASALRASGSAARVIGCEVDTAAPLAASLAVDAPAVVEHTSSWVDGIGGSGLLPEMWPLVRSLVEGALVSSLEEISEAVRTLALSARLVAEGAGAASLAPVLAGRAPAGCVVCIVSGGNINLDVFRRALGGR